MQPALHNALPGRSSSIIAAFRSLQLAVEQLLLGLGGGKHGNSLRGTGWRSGLQVRADPGAVAERGKGLGTRDHEASRSQAVHAVQVDKVVVKDVLGKRKPVDAAVASAQVAKRAHVRRGGKQPVVAQPPNVLGVVDAGA